MKLNCELYVSVAMACLSIARPCWATVTASFQYIGQDGSKWTATLGTTEVLEKGQLGLGVQTKDASFNVKSQDHKVELTNLQWIGFKGADGNSWKVRTNCHWSGYIDCHFTAARISPDGPETDFPKGIQIYNWSGQKEIINLARVSADKGTPLILITPQ